MKRPLVLLLSVLAISSCLPSAAEAAVGASFEEGVLTVASDNSGVVDESYTVRDEGANVVVASTPGPAADPDGAGTTCNHPTANEVQCVRSAVDSVRILAGAGVDTINDNRTQGPSLLEGGGGNDEITTTSGAEAELLGQAGADTLKSASEDDTLLGGEEGDTLIAVGSKGFDGVDSGGPGPDVFVGNPSLSDDLIAEPGADKYGLGTHLPSEGDPATFQLIQYPDSVSYALATTPVVLSLDGVANDGRGPELDNVGADVEVVSGGSGPDSLHAGQNAAELIGLAGGDELVGGPGPDRLKGGGGSDALRGEGGDDDLEDGDFTIAVTAGPQPPAGNDLLAGGDGDDSLQADRGADDISGGPGIDRTTFSRPIPQAPSVPTPIAPAGFTVSLDDVNNDGQTGSGEGDNVHSDIEAIESSDGDDVIVGSGAANEISTEGGEDVVDPGAGPDVVDLGAGDDRITAVDQTTDIIRCRAGVDTADVDLAGPQAPGDELSDCESVTGTPIPALGGSAPTVAATTPPAGDAIRPVVALSSKPIKVGTFLETGQLQVTVSCNEPCSAVGKAYRTSAKGRPAGKPIGAGKLKIGTGKRVLHITVARKFRNQLKSSLRTKAQRQRGLKLRVLLTVRDEAGNATDASRAVTVKG